jgi:hypothetical protein
MFGFLIGTASLVGLVWVLSHGRYWHGYGHAHGCYRRGPHHLYGVLARLDTTPGQEKVIRSAVEDFVDSLRERGRLLRQSAEDIGRAVRGEQLDEALLGDVFARHDRLLAELRRDAVAALGRVHETLDEGQRRKLARLMESHGGWGWGHPGCHTACGCH